MSSNLVPTIRRSLELLDNMKRREQYFDDPILWAKDRLGVTVWMNPSNPKRSQAELLRSIAKNKDTAVKAGHSVSKSFSVALAIVWWLDTRYPDVFVASTAPSVAQISGAVWAEVRKFRKTLERRYESGLNEYPGPPGYITSDNMWKEDDGTILGWGRKPPDQDIDSAFQGIHRKYVLAIGDEAVGLSEELIDALSNITSNETSRRVIVCNPTNPSSYIGRLFKEKPKNWNFITISVFDNPNFTGEEVPVETKESLADESFVESKRQEYGEGSPRWNSRVLGEFDYDTTNSLFTDREFSVAFDCDISPGYESRPVLGVDVARFGGDSSVIYLNEDGRVRFYSSWEKTSGTDTASIIHRAAIDTGAREVRIDGLGLGGPIVDLVLQHSEGKYAVREIRGSAASPDRKQWHNWRAWSFDKVRGMMLDGLIDLDYGDRKLADELGGIEYRFADSGGLVIESKDDMRKRGIKSPDHADAFIYAAIPDDVIESANQKNVMVSLDHGYFVEEHEKMWDIL